MWNPEISFDQSILATIQGSIGIFVFGAQEHRGTREFPGLVLGLELVGPVLVGHCGFSGVERHPTGPNLGKGDDHRGL